MPTDIYSPANANAYVGFGKQAAKGSAIAPSYFAAFLGGVELNPNAGMRVIREGGTGTYIARHTKDLYVPGLKFGCAARPILAGAILAFLLGDDTISGASDPYTHTLTAATSNLWLTLERNVDDDLIERIVDSVLTEVTIDIRKRDQGAEVLLTAVGTGLTLDRPSATAESYESSRPFLRSDVASWSLDNAAETNVESATITLRWRYDEAISADAVTRLTLAKLHLEVEVQTVQVWSAAADKSAYVGTHYGTASGTAASATVYGSTTKAFEVDLSYTESAKARQLKVTIPAMEWTEAKVTEPDPEASQVGRLTRKGIMVKPSAGAAITVVSKSSLATAYDA